MRASSGSLAIWRAWRCPAMFAAWLRPLRAIPWVVYAKRPFGGPEQVLDYLGRYTHRVAIATAAWSVSPRAGLASAGRIIVTTTSKR
jgi:putative transposase